MATYVLFWIATLWRTSYFAHTHMTATIRNDVLAKRMTATIRNDVKAAPSLESAGEVCGCHILQGELYGPSLC